jgi:hypothetical protein
MNVNDIDIFNGIDDIEINSFTEYDVRYIPEDTLHKKYYIDKADPICHINMFTNDGKYVNLSNLTMRTTAILIEKEKLIERLINVAIEDANKQGKKRSNFSLFESATNYLATHLNSENFLVKDASKNRSYLNVDGLKDVLLNSRCNMSKNTTTIYIRCAKKANIIRQIGKGQNAKFMLNPVIANGSFFAKVSKEALLEFGDDIKVMFNNKQYNDCVNLLLNNGTDEEIKRLKKVIK